LAENPGAERTHSKRLIASLAGVSPWVVGEHIDNPEHPAHTRATYTPKPLPDGVVCRARIAAIARLHLAPFRPRGVWATIQPTPRNAFERFELADVMEQIRACRQSPKDSEP